MVVWEICDNLNVWEVFKHRPMTNPLISQLSFFEDIIDESVFLPINITFLWNFPRCVNNEKHGLCTFLRHVTYFPRISCSQSKSQINCCSDYSRVQWNVFAVRFRCWVLVEIFSVHCNAESPFSGQKSKDVWSSFVFTSFTSLLHNQTSRVDQKHSSCLHLQRIHWQWPHHIFPLLYSLT